MIISSLLKVFLINVLLKDDLYYQLYAYTHPYNEDVMTYLIESLDDSGFLSYPLDQYMSDLHIDQDMLDAHLGYITFI